MASNPLASLSALGQSVWLDTIRRGLLTSGEFARLVEANGLLGVTSNPSIFEKAIAESSDYDDAIRALAASGKSSAEICETLMIEDIRRAADLLRAVFERLEGRDGFVSLDRDDRRLPRPRPSDRAYGTVRAPGAGSPRAPVRDRD